MNDGTNDQEKERDRVVVDYAKRGDLLFWPHHILENIDIKDFHNLFNILYYIGIIPCYL
jgi:hypothetical protein